MNTLMHIQIEYNKSTFNFPTEILPKTFDNMRFIRMPVLKFKYFGYFVAWIQKIVLEDIYGIEINITFSLMYIN